MDEVRYTLGSADVLEPYFYRGEGNAHLALALPQSRRVLRIKKVHDRDDPYVESADTDCEDDWNRDIRFYREIITPLFGPFVDNVEPVQLSPSEIFRLEEVLAEQRPENRKHKRLCCNNAAIFNDYAYLPKNLNDVGAGPTFSIEIKPKQGIRSKEGSCTFCAKQKSKFKEGKIASITDYCPLELFSLDEQDVEDAISALTRNPQNNFKVFKDGELCFGENFEFDCFKTVLMDLFGQKNSSLTFCYLIRMALRRQFPRTGCQKEAYVRHSVLDCLYTVQSFDNLQRLRSFQFSGFSYVKKYLKDVEEDENRCPRCVMSRYESDRMRFQIFGCHMNEDCITEDLLLSLCIPHYISRIARDCSLMVTLRKATKLDKNVRNDILEHLIETEYGCFVFDVKVFDLYPKMPKKVYHIAL